MNYRIDTAPISDALSENTECPFCAIRGMVEERLLDQFTGEAVMEDSARDRVNRAGFCPAHFHALHALPNKLGIALQSSTRLRELSKAVVPVKNVRAAKKQADSLSENLCGCVICGIADTHMERYAQSFAQMFVRESDFADRVKASKGFCVSHYALLLRHAGYAGSSSDKYLALIYGVMKDNLDRMQSEIDFFCDKFDYRNADKPWNGREDAPARTILKIRKNK